MLLDLIDLSKLRRAVVYGVLLAVLFLFQDLLLSAFTIRGVHLMLIPAAVVAVGLFDGASWGGFFGLAAGYFMDFGYPEHVCLFAVLLPLIGFFAGVLGKYFLHKGFLSYMTLCALALVIVTFCQMFRFLFLVDTGAAAVWRTAAIQVLWSLPWAAPVYLPCKSIASRPLGDH